jgi:hypothetical protein
MAGVTIGSELPPAWNVPQEDVWIWLGDKMGGGEWTELGPGHGGVSHNEFREPAGLDPLHAIGPELAIGRGLADAFPDEQIALVKYTYATNMDDWDPEKLGPPDRNHLYAGLREKSDNATVNKALSLRVRQLVMYLEEKKDEKACFCSVVAANDDR